MDGSADSAHLRYHRLSGHGAAADPIRGVAESVADSGRSVLWADSRHLRSAFGRGPERGPDDFERIPADATNERDGASGLQSRLVSHGGRAQSPGLFARS